MPGRCSPQSANLIGAVVAILIYVLVILVFSARLAGSPRAEHWLGAAAILFLFMAALAFFQRAKTGM